VSTVLVVDDSVIERELAGELLRRIGGTTVAFAGDGTEALEVVKAAPPELVVVALHVEGDGHSDRGAEELGLEEHAGAAGNVAGQVVGDGVHVRARLACSDAQLDALPCVTEAVRQAHHAAHQLVGDLHRSADLSGAGAHDRLVAAAEAALGGVVGMHLKRAAVAPLCERRKVVKPRVHVA